MKNYSGLIEKLKTLWKVEYDREAAPTEYLWGGLDIATLLKNKIEAKKGVDPYHELAADVIGDFLKKPVIIPFYFIDKDERNKKLEEIRKKDPALYTLFLERRNSTKHLESIIGLMEIVFENEEPEFKASLWRLLERQRKALGTTHHVIRCTEDATKTIKEWCIQYIQSEH